jgi:hypothetical protein
MCNVFRRAATENLLADAIMNNARSQVLRERFVSSQNAIIGVVQPI